MFPFLVVLSLMNARTGRSTRQPAGSIPGSSPQLPLKDFKGAFDFLLRRLGLTNGKTKRIHKTPRSRRIMKQNPRQNRHTWKTKALNKSAFKVSARAHGFCLFVSYVRLIGLNVLAYQSHLLQRCHPACGHPRISPSLPGSTLRFFIAMQVQHSYTSSTNG